MYDELERAAQNAVMREVAHRSKKPKVSDLFKRPTNAKADKSRLAQLKQKTHEANAWLARLVSGGRKE